jgi:hypothetical protein
LLNQRRAIEAPNFTSGKALIAHAAANRAKNDIAVTLNAVSEEVYSIPGVLIVIGPRTQRRCVREEAAEHLCHT